jgi:hypothetical protein
MQRIALPPIERRLQKRYVMLVQSHLRSAPALAAGIGSMPAVSSSLAATQGAWRFLNNDRVELSSLIEPLRAVGRERVTALESDFVMLVHDWSKISYRHGSKTDRAQLTHSTDIGYDLTTTLLVSADDGSPLAPMEMHLKTKQGTLSTCRRKPATVHHLEQILPTMRASRRWGLDRRILHVVDREADSLDHFRKWAADGHHFLVRADDRSVKWRGKVVLLTNIAATLRSRKAFRHVGAAEHRSRPAQLWVAETEVVLHRSGRKRAGGRRICLGGRPLTLRFLVVQLRNSSGRVLAEWFLLTNAPSAWGDAEKLAHCYYWRWRIESFFKLMKSHGQQMEHWQQETAAAIARRLVVAAMACVVVWQLQMNPTADALQLKTVLVRLSGRQMKRTRPHTAPALLNGLWTLLAMLALLKHYKLSEIKKLTELIPCFDTG